MTYYFIKEGDNERGPFTINQLKTKSIKKVTPVWFAGLEEWTNAGQVFELKELFLIKVPSQVLPKTKINKIWEHKLLKQQLKKVSYQIISIRARKNLY
jgi:hypothetical protein